LAAVPLTAQEPTALEAAVTLENAFVDAIARAEKSVVAIARYRQPSAGLNRPGEGPIPLAPGQPPSGADAPNEFATGVVIDRRGYILTNYHVLGDPTENVYRVWVNRRPFWAVSVQPVQEVRAGDPWTDLAVLKIEADDLQPIVFGDTKNLRKGQIVVALGNPYGIARDGQVSASWGIISNLSRGLPPASSRARPEPGKDSLYQYGGLIQTDARLNMGTSGGALINLKGEMVGLITALAATEGYERSLGFAIPVDDVFRRTVETLKAGHKAEFGFLGVAPENLSDAMLRQGQFGARVLNVVAGTPAAVARLKQDDIITHINGQVVYDRATLMRELGRQPAGGDIRLTVERGAGLGRRGRVFDADVTMSKRYIAASPPAFSQVEDPFWRGLVVDYGTALPQDLLLQVFQADTPNGCLAAVTVQRDSPAWMSGLRPGSLFTHAGGRRVTTPDEFYEAVADQRGPVRIKLVSADPDEVTVSP
jgi:serine protease Do